MKIIVETEEQKQKILEQSKYIHDFLIGKDDVNGLGKDWLIGLDSDKAGTLMHLYMAPQIIEVITTKQLKVMNKEQIIDEVYENFEKWYNEHSGKEDYTGYYVPTKEEFIRLIKTNSEFSEKWGLKIEERELSLEERMGLCKEKWYYSWNRTINLEDIEWRMNNEWNTPTKLITLTYNNETIESYE